MRKSWEEYDEKIVNWIHGQGSAVVVAAFLFSYDMELGKWHRSKGTKDAVGRSIFASVMINKKWWLEEELNNLILQIDQVSVGTCLFIFIVHFQYSYVYIS